MSDHPIAPSLEPQRVVTAPGSAGTGSLDAVARAEELVRLFAEPGPGFATFRNVDRAEVPEPDRTLLDHTSHMTVAMEGHHGAPLGLRVVARGPDMGTTADQSPWYAREILLLSPQGTLVQYGIVRINQHVVRIEILVNRANRQVVASAETTGDVLHDLSDDCGLIGFGQTVERFFERIE